MNCIKCGSTDLYIKFKNKDYEYNKSRSDIVNLSKFTKQTDWQTYGYTAYIATKEHLFCSCKTCEYQWLQDTLDNTKEKQND